MMATLHVIVVALHREAHATAATLHSANTMRSIQERACQRLAAVAPWCRRAAGSVGVQGRGAENWGLGRQVLVMLKKDTDWPGELLTLILGAGRMSWR
ncbi:hypothetical protein B0T11DRAFT_283272 [Plectosphaerella cucumerina]|uniref:Secreted protein n=1 Tax=Plectosphaerella cucumerina TaxID=40658 RepID=A0A8K0T9S2_9PEZI|nr:hypothetical protein B0T11DRAFT_283272 [Plectosphaerella cucumerina]